MYNDPTHQVQPIKALTRPMTNTKLSVPVWFFCTIQNASMHRPDGKKLPFVQGFFKAIFEEDFHFLENEAVDPDNPFIRRATQAEQEQAKMLEDPLGTIKDHLRGEVRQEVADSLDIEELEKLLALRRAQKEVGGAQKPGIVEPPKNAAVGQPAAVIPVPANEDQAAKMKRLAAEALALAKNGKLNPASTSQSASADSNSNG